MVQRNPNLGKLQAGYLFPEIHKRKQEFLQAHPDANLISLGIGDTTQPIPLSIAKALTKASAELGSITGYSGYGPEQGNRVLRKQIASKWYKGKVSDEEIFISDGAKCDIGRLQMLFGTHLSIAVQDPSYPVYVDTAVLTGKTGDFFHHTQQYGKIVYLPCLPENDFFPDLGKIPRTDIVFLCSPNNPTGAAATREQLVQLVDFVRQNGSLLIYDAAYSIFIQDEDIPKSIYEIPKADEVAIELGSFSKMAGFTGIRLGWSVVPEKLRYEDGSSVKQDWIRILSTCFNGASNIAQAGGIAALDEPGIMEIHGLTDYYLQNAQKIRDLFARAEFDVYGGVHSPYVWVRFPGKNSWKAFEELLHETQIVTTPGSGFGPAGEGFLRFSSFGSRESVEEAIRRLEKHFLRHEDNCLVGREC